MCEGHRGKQMRSPWKAAIALAAFSTTGVTWTVIAQSGRTVADGVYTAAQAQRGQEIYEVECRACHGATLAGGLAPPLSGADFLRVWDRRPLADVVDKIQHTMPATKPGTLSRVQATDLVAYLLQASAFKAGPAALGVDDTLKQIAIVSAPGTLAAAPAVTVGGDRPPGNMAQVMRGILFPSSNLLFNVQNQDPGEQKPGWSPGGPTSFSWVDWGAGIYSGWELVDYEIGRAHV